MNETTVTWRDHLRPKVIRDDREVRKWEEHSRNHLWKIFKRQKSTSGSKPHYNL